MRERPPQRDARRSSSDWKIEDVEAVCREYVIECSPWCWGSSHFQVTHPALPHVLAALQGADQTSDGETPEEALVNVQDVIATGIEGMQDLGRPMAESPRKVA